ncbi:MAG: hypothetical protein ABFC96_17050 [Thermoguttaceae bacterium]
MGSILWQRAWGIKPGVPAGDWIDGTSGRPYHGDAMAWGVFGCTTMARTPSKIDRACRTVMLLFGIASILSVGWATASWPHCSNWDVKKHVCAAVMNAGTLFALMTWLSGLVWLALSKYPGWGVGALVCIYFLFMCFAMTPRL